MKNINKIMTILVLFIIVLSGYAVLDFRHSFVRDVTLSPNDSTKFSKKYQNKNVYEEELGYDDPKIGDTVVVRIFSDDNPWLDGYFYEVVSPKETLNNLTSGKQQKSNHDTTYQSMRITSIKNNDLQKIF